ncbi:hypothetical protein CBM2614_B60006 [Cupriavidus taiwanensis]|nr:hypothetical protein CBM2614_B60006 [Cupriavidus taiwanensis]
MSVEQGHYVRVAFRRHISHHVVISAIEKQPDVYFPCATNDVIVSGGSTRTFAKFTRRRRPCRA